MRLTDAGRAFLPYAERAMRAVRDGRQALTDARSASAGRLVLGAAPAVSTYVLPALLQRFAGAYPRIEVAVRTGHSEDVLQMLLREEVQLAMVRTLRHPDIESIPLYEEALVLVVAPGHPFADRSNVGIADVASERLIFFDRTSSYYELTQSFFLSLGVTPREVMELDNIESAKKINRGWTSSTPGLCQPRLKSKCWRTWIISLTLSMYCSSRIRRRPNRVAWSLPRSAIIF